MSRFFEAVRRAEESRGSPRPPAASGSPGSLDRATRPFRVLAVVSNKGGVGKTTVATNLAVYLRALDEDLPILLFGLDDQSTIDRMFALDGSRPVRTIADALRTSSLGSAIRLGQYGVHYVPSSPRIAELKREVLDPTLLHAVLERSGWRGLVVVDTKSDIEILTQNALAASDLALVLVRDLASVHEAEKIFDLLARWGRPAEAARVLLSQIDRRIKYAGGTERDVLALLLAEVRRRGYPLLSGFLSSSPKVESLQTNPGRLAQSILHGAPGSLVHDQMRNLAAEVLEILERAHATDSAARRPEPAAGSEPPQTASLPH